MKTLTLFIACLFFAFSLPARIMEQVYDTNNAATVDAHVLSLFTNGIATTSTNFNSGFAYTNDSSQSLLVVASIGQFTTAGPTEATMSILLYNTNGGVVLGKTLSYPFAGAGSLTNTIACIIPPHYGYVFTNVSGGNTGFNITPGTGQYVAIGAGPQGPQGLTGPAGGASILVNSNVWYFSQGATNSISKVGRQDLPLSSLASATNAAYGVYSNFTFVFSPGRYVDTNIINAGALSYFDFVNLTGCGRENTAIIFSRSTFATSDFSAWQFANVNFQDLSIVATNPGNVPVYAGWRDTTEPVTNIFINCSISGGNDDYVILNDSQTVTKFINCDFSSGWDAYASWTVASTLGLNSNSLVSFKDCYVDINTNRSSAVNSSQSAHLINAPYVPSVEILNTQVRIRGADAGLIFTNPTAYVTIITNASLKLMDSFFDVQSTTTPATGPDVLVSLFSAVSTNIFVQNVSWRSNGIYYRIPDTAPMVPHTPYGNLFTGATLEHYTNNATFTVLTNYSDAMFGGGCLANKVLGTLTNHPAGTWAVSGKMYLQDVAASGSTFTVSIFTNNVAAGFQVVASLDTVISTATIQLLDLGTQTFDLPDGCRIDFRVKSDTVTPSYWLLGGGSLEIYQR